MPAGPRVWEQQAAGLRTRRLSGRGAGPLPGMGPGARVGPSRPRLLPARAGAAPSPRPSVRRTGLAANRAWAAERGTPSPEASALLLARDRVGAKRQWRHVLAEAAQTLLQVLPPAAGPD